MSVMPILFFLIVGVDEPGSSASSKPVTSTSRPALEFDFRPVRVVDLREKDIASLFPPKKKTQSDARGESRAAKATVGVDAGCRKGLTIQFKLATDLENQELVLRKLQISELVPDEGVWPKPLAGVWLNNTEIGDEDMEEHLRIFRHHDTEADGVMQCEFDVDVALNRPPAQVRMIMQLRGTLEFEVIDHEVAAIDIDQAKIGKFEPNSVLKKAGVKVRLNKPGKGSASNRSIAAEFTGTIKNIVDAYIAEPPAKEGEQAGRQIYLDESTTTESSTFFGSGGKRNSRWDSKPGIPAGARLVVRVVTERRIETAPFSFEEIPLPR